MVNKTMRERYRLLFMVAPFLWRDFLLFYHQRKANEFASIPRHRRVNGRAAQLPRSADFRPTTCHHGSSHSLSIEHKTSSFHPPSHLYISITCSHLPVPEHVHIAALALETNPLHQLLFSPTSKIDSTSLPNFPPHKLPISLSPYLPLETTNKTLQNNQTKSPFPTSPPPNSS